GERVLVSTPEGLTEIVLDTGELRRQHDGAHAIAITPSWKHNLALVTDRTWMVHVVYLPDQHAAYAFKLPRNPLQVIDNRAGTRLFVLMEGRATVGIIDTEQFIETDSVSLHGIDPTRARIAPSPDGTTLYILDTSSSRLIAVDLGTKQISADLTLTGTAVDLAVSGDGAWLAVALTGENRVALLDADLGAHGSVALSDAPTAMIAPR
ncbi:MAG: YncE family protein, partial [Vicinamibacterales bacterium]